MAIVIAVILSFPFQMEGRHGKQAAEKCQNSVEIRH